MIEHCPIDRDSLDVHFCRSPSAHVDLMRTLELFHAWFTRDLRQPARLPLPQERNVTPPTWPSRQRPCHPPLALAPRRLYTSPMRNPTSAYPGLPDTARGISPRSRNCPESGPPYPQNGSCRTGRIVSAADGFEADSFPKIKNLEFNQIAGVPLVLRVRPREGRT